MMLKATLKKLNELTLRMKYALIILGTLIIFTFLMQWSDRLAVQRASVETAKSRLVELETLRTTNIWQTRLSQSQELNEEAKLRLWQGATEGVIAAEIDQELRAIADLSGIRQLRITVDPVATQVGNLTIMSFQINASAPANYTALPFVVRLSATDQSLFIEEARFNIDRRGRSNSTVTLTGFAPIRMAENADADDN